MGYRNLILVAWTFLLVAVARQFFDEDIRCLEVDSDCVPTQGIFHDDDVEEPESCPGILSPDDVFPWEDNDEA